jgi:hypothetical protein
MSTSQQQAGGLKDPRDPRERKSIWRSYAASLSNAFHYTGFEIVFLEHATFVLARLECRSVVILSF